MDTKKLIKSIYVLTTTIIILSVLYVFLFVVSLNKPKEDVVIEDNNIQETVNIDNNEYSTYFTKEKFEEYRDINEDYIGQIVFESKIVNEPIVYSDINGYYLRKNLNKDYSIQGTVYLDERNILSDQNLILYGHYTEPGFTDYEGYDPDIRPMFTNLDLLLDKENYKDNKTVYLFLEDEVREYEIVSVYYCPLYLDEDGNYSYVTEGYEYYLVEYDDESFNSYKDTILTNQQYDIGSNFDNFDRYLTLQTCVARRPDLREIVLCKEVKVSEY